MFFVNAIRINRAAARLLIDLDPRGYATRARDEVLHKPTARRSTAGRCEATAVVDTRLDDGWGRLCR
jgi:hypothetical protein